MTKIELINNIEQNLSILLSLLNYHEYIDFIKIDFYISFFDRNIDKPYSNIIFSRNFLLKTNNKIKKKIQNI